MASDKLIVGIGDVHFPWANYECLEWIYGMIRTLQPDVVVQVGDLYDFRFLSSFAKLAHTTPLDEWQRGRRAAEQMWNRIRQAAPRAQRIQLKGNHETRLAKRLADKWPEAEPFLDLDKPFLFPGVETQRTENREIILPGPVVLMHGFMGRGAHASKNCMNTVKGHSHAGYVSYTRTRAKHWELDCGTAADIHSEAFDYRSQTQLSEWTNGVGVVLGDVPMFIPFPGGKQ